MNSATHPRSSTGGPPAAAALLSETEFRRIGELVQGASGICLSAAKRTRAELRLHQRLRALGLQSFGEYIERLAAGPGSRQELNALVDALSVNTTAFFREPAHFRFLVETVIPAWRDAGDTGRPMRLWSAACSTGEEPYTLAMVVSEAGVTGARFSIHATDVSTVALRKGVAAVYTTEEARGVPPALLAKYFLCSKDRSKRVVRVGPETRRLVTFGRFNLVGGSTAGLEPADVIFCRNVLIYFDRQTQEAVVRRLCHNLRPGGFLFTGHAEALNGFSLPMDAVAPTVYRKPL